ncbi:uncharacterized protein LOC121784335 [Salvia splendens]|uniref:uncharacterized protein LOC121784335 n=1 Tax=Salvia splendens TaxID=180675 RepID=UPI001C2742DC|nr:uncharacterized protein LOC121784335 [Salvia splendens]
MSPYRIVFDKMCHLPVEIKHRAYWAVKEINMKPQSCEEERKLQLQELEELRLESYESAMWYKEKTKLWHDQSLRVKELQVGQKVLLFQSRLKLMPGKLKSQVDRAIHYCWPSSKWSCENPGQCLKLYSFPCQWSSGKGF